MRPSQGIFSSAFVLALAFLTGCEFGSGGSDGPSAANRKRAQEAAEKGSTSLSTSLTSMTGSQYEYGSEDLTSLKKADSDYQEALRLDPGNGQARMGAALTGVLLAAQSDNLSSVMNQAIEAPAPFDPNFVQNAPLARTAVLRKVTGQAVFPEFHEIQDAIGDTLLPALEKAIANLRAVYNDPAFSMTLTIDETVREIDHAEISVLLAGFMAVHGLATLFLSYDIDLDDNGSYDYLKELEGVGDVDFANLTPAQENAFDVLTGLLDQKSPFLAVKPAWQARLAKVDDEIKEAAAVLSNGLASIRNEKDDQEDDILKICDVGLQAECIDDDDLAAAEAVIDSVKKYLEVPYGFYIPEIDSTVHIYLAAYFNIQDYKKMLPYYGFYKAADWSEDKPVFYFTNAGGTITGDLNDLEQIGADADSLGWTVEKTIAEIRKVIHLPDPTFQGYLPGGTEDKVWDLVAKLADIKDTVIYDSNTMALVKRAAGSMDPEFPLTLLGGR